MSTLEFPGYSPEEEEKEFLQRISEIILSAKNALTGRGVSSKIENNLKEAIRILEEAIEQKNYKGIQQKMALLERALGVMKKEQEKQLELDRLYQDKNGREDDHLDQYRSYR